MAGTALAASATIPTDPQSGKNLWWCEGGTCYPRFLEVAGWFKGVQRAVNAWRKKRGVALINVDGRIGNQTALAVNEIRVAENIPGGYLNPEQIAALAVQVATEIAQKAGVQPSFDPNPKATPQEIPTTVPPETMQLLEREKSGGKKWWIIGGLAVVGVGILGFVLFRRSQGRPLFGALAGGDFGSDDGDDYDDDPPPQFGNVIDV